MCFLRDQILVSRTPVLELKPDRLRQVIVKFTQCRDEKKTKCSYMQSSQEYWHFIQSIVRSIPFSAVVFLFLD